MSPRFCLLLSFVGGFNVMLLEICALRVLPTTFGSSVYVTGTLLALIMNALSLGYYTGGFLSSRLLSLKALLVMILGAVVYVHLTNVLAINPILDSMFSMYRKGSPLLAIGGSSLLLYFVPMLVLSQVTPFLISHLNRTGHHQVGQLAGKLMAVSTVGSIAGTLAPTFLLIPELGVRATLLIFELSLAVLAVGGLILLRGGGRRAAAVGTALILLLLASHAWVKPPVMVLGDQQLVLESESLYGNIKLVSRRDEFGERLTYYPNRSYAHSSVYPATPMRNSPVSIDYLTFLSATVERRAAGKKKMLVLGTALGTALVMAHQIDPTLSITGVEIDDEVVQMSKRFLPQLNDPNITLVAQDARVFLKESEETFDFILVDLFAGDFLPPHCITREFFSLIRARMPADGVMFINSNMPEARELEATNLSSLPRVVWHLESAIFNAGFGQILKTDFPVNGHLTAFIEPRPVEQHRAVLRAQAAREALPVEYRAQLALESFALSEVPTARAQAAEPFTDDWVPDAMIHRRERAKPLATPAATATFCKRVADLAQQAESASEVFQFFARPDDIRKCATVFEASVSKEKPVRQLLLSAAQVQEGHPEHALPQLLTVLSGVTTPTH